MAWNVGGGWKPTRWLVIGALCASSACGDDSSEDDIVGEGATGSTADASTPAPGSWCAAREVLQSACVECHGATLSAGAPMSLETFADLQAGAKITKGKKVYEVVKSRIHDSANPMPPQRTLTATELAAVDDWIAAGAKAGSDPTCANVVKNTPPVPQDPWPPVGCEQVYELRAGGPNGEKATISPGAETHPQFYIDAPWGNDKVQALGFRPITDNKKVLHHWIIYENNGGRQGAFVTGWAPGQDDTARKALPENIGIYLPTGPRSLRLDMHYFNLTGTQLEEDASGVEVCVTRSFRPITATTFQNFSAIPLIAPGADVDMTGTCQVQLTEPVFLMSESPHAHTLANWTKLIVQRGSETIVLHDKAFRFEEQTATPITPFFELKNGDVVSTTCHYKNDSNRFVIFGESTNSEMCFNFATYYPMGALSCAGGGTLPL